MSLKTHIAYGNMTFLSELAWPVQQVVCLGLHSGVRIFNFPVGLASAAGSVSQLAFRSLQFRFSGPAPFISCQLLVKGRALSTG